MAHVLAIGAGNDPAIAGRPLVRTLATLPDGWTLLVDLCIGGASAGCIEAILVHAEIGVALIDDAPGDASLARAFLCRLLQRERFSDYFPGDLPVVAIDALAEPPGAIGEQLAAAFDVAPRLSVADRDWAYAVIELIIESGRLDMTTAQETVEAASAELIFHGAGALSSRATRSAEAELEMQRPRVIAAALSPQRVQLSSLVPVWLLDTRAAAPAPARSRGVIAAQWAGVAAALLAVAWGFDNRLEYTPRLVEVEEAVFPPAPIEPIALAAGARTGAQPLDDLARRMATSAPSGSRFDATVRANANAGDAEPDTASKAVRAPPSAAGRPKAGRSAKASAASDAVNHSATGHVECADWLHQNRPGGSDYRGPSVAACPKRR
jgi:hypothetical protein